MDVETDGLAVINVDQLSRDVHAIVQASVMVDSEFDDIPNSEEPQPEFNTHISCAPSIDSLSQVYYSSSSLVPVTSAETTYILSDGHLGTQTGGDLEASKLVQQLNKGVNSGVPSQRASTSKKLHQHHGTSYTSHLRPILPATMAPRNRQGQRSGQAMPRSEPSSQVELVESQLQAELRAVGQRTSGDAGAVCIPASTSSQNEVTNFPSASITMDAGNIGDHDGHDSTIQLTNQSQPLVGMNPPGPLNVQVPVNGGPHSLNPLSSYSAQMLLAQLALMSPGNPDNTGSTGQSQSLLSPHSQSTLLPYLLRTMASLGQPGGNSVEMSLLAEPMANDCGEDVVPAVEDLSSPQPSHEGVSYSADQHMNTALCPVSAANQLPLHADQTFQPAKSVEQGASSLATQVTDLAIGAEHSAASSQVATPNLADGLPMEGNCSERSSILAPSIITSSIHSLCLPLPGAATPVSTEPNLATVSSNQLNIPSSMSLLSSSVQLGGVTAESRGPSDSGPSRSLDLQSLAMQISNIPSSTSHQQALLSLEGTNLGDEFWCVHCNETMPQVCPHHGPPTVITDTPILRRARMTLPSSLYLKRSNISKDFIGVWAKVLFRPGCQFGPMEGTVKKKLASDADNLSPYIWKIFQNNRVKHYLDVKNEDVSNWMMFVRRARKHEEQNVAAHQMKGKIYYTTKREIKPGEELMLWFNREYAQMSGATLLPEDSFKCTLCGRQFSYRQELEGHMLYRHPSADRRRHSCRVCGKAFATTTKLNVHTLKHTGDRPHVCKICHKSFTDGSNLKRHARIHSGEKQFQCSVCLMYFRQKAHLITHSVVHTGEKKLKCQFCLKLFARKSDLTQHMHLHSHEKKHKCTFCLRTFARKEHLKNHITTHTKERNFACNLCGKTYRTEAHLRKHKIGCKKKHSSVEVMEPP